ncbi:unnamed protein product [Caenorhabditis sp. 36 PRJEB53466]|nr:unnamed protein product [Caenorhabditis sp. 36 PRJEB53466]
MDQAQLKYFFDQQQKTLKALLDAFNKTTRPAADANSIVNSLSNRIAFFSYDPEDGETFDAWFSRYEDIIRTDGAELDDAARARLVVSKLNKREAERYRNNILPRAPKDVTFEDTITELRRLFNETKSVARLRFELLTTKFTGQDLKDYTGMVKRRFNAAKWTDFWTRPGPMSPVDHRTPVTRPNGAPTPSSSGTRDGSEDHAITTDGQAGTGCAAQVGCHSHWRSCRSSERDHTETQ